MNEPHNSTQNTADKPAPRRWTKRLFWLSLSLNLLVLGAVGATLWRFSGGDGFHLPARASLGASELIRALPARERHALRDEMGQKGQGDSRREQVVAWRSDMLSALRADPFQPDAVDALLAQNNQDMAVRIEQGQVALIARIAEMSQAERRAYADKVETGMTRRDGRRRLRR